MNAAEKLEILKDTCSDDTELDSVLGKLLDVSLGRCRLHMERYDQELHDLESRFGMPSAEFYRRFEAGELGDDTDYFEWAGLYELREELLSKIRRLEQAA